MKIVDRKTFLSLPAGTLFYKYEPVVLSEFGIKGETLPNTQDFFSVTLDQLWVDSPSSSDFHTPLLEMQEDGVEYPIDVEVEGRDARFDEDQLFAVLDVQDVRVLIARLTKCLPD